MTNKLDLSKPVYTRGDKEEWIVLCGDANTISNSNWEFSLIAIKKSTGKIGRWRPDGRIGTAFGSPDDLINVPEKYVRHLNVYKQSSGRMLLTCYDTSASADAGAGDKRIARLRIEFEEGQFDE